MRSTADSCFLTLTVFFFDSSDDERSGSATAPKRQAQAILTFASLALQQMPVASSSSKDSSSELLAILLDISVTKEARLAQVSLDQVCIIAREAIAHTLRKVAAKDFILGVHKVLDTGKPTVSFPRVVSDVTLTLFWQSRFKAVHWISSVSS